MEGQEYGRHIQRSGGAGNGRRSKPNVKQKEILTSLSVSIQERSTDKYSPVRKPKAPDKHARHVDNKYNPEAHNAPRTTERDCVEQSLKQQDADDTQPGNPNKTPKMSQFGITRVRGRLQGG
jgi:hypothetical protein